MNYRHSYHAGNFADVFKHLLLISLFSFMKRKDKAFCYLETHAGKGKFNLESEESQKTQEYIGGIAKVVSQCERSTPESIPLIINSYLSILGKNDYPPYYPGSPLIAKSCLRPQDEMILMELHPEEIKWLIANVLSNKQHKEAIHIHQQNGYDALNGLLPPKARRGLIFIDPPFEKPSEWEDIITNLAIAFRKFPSGVYAIWYPLKEKQKVSSFYDRLQGMLEQTSIKNIVRAEMSIYPEDVPVGLYGCGMAVVNPPWQWVESVEEFLPWIWKVLSVEGMGSYLLETL